MSRNYSAREKKSLLSELSRSGESVSEFSRRKGLATSTLWKWRRNSNEGEIGDDFIEVQEHEQYELQVGDLTLRIPCTEKVERVVELAKALSC